MRVPRYGHYARQPPRQAAEFPLFWVAAVSLQLPAPTVPEPTAATAVLAVSAMRVVPAPTAREGVAVVGAGGSAATVLGAERRQEALSLC